MDRQLGPSKSALLYVNNDELQRYHQNSQITFPSQSLLDGGAVPRSPSFKDDDIPLIRRSSSGRTRTNSLRLPTGLKGSSRISLSQPDLMASVENSDSYSPPDSEAKSVFTVTGYVDSVISGSISSFDSTPHLSLSSSMKGDICSPYLPQRSVSPFLPTIFEDDTPSEKPFSIHDYVDSVMKSCLSSHPHTETKVGNSRLRASASSGTSGSRKAVQGSRINTYASAASMITLPSSRLPLELTQSKKAEFDTKIYVGEILESALARVKKGERKFEISKFVDEVISSGLIRYKTDKSKNEGERNPQISSGPQNSNQMSSNAFSVSQFVDDIIECAIKA